MKRINYLAVESRDAHGRNRLVTVYDKANPDTPLAMFRTSAFFANGIWGMWTRAAASMGHSLEVKNLNGDDGYLFGSLDEVTR